MWASYAGDFTQCQRAPNAGLFSDMELSPQNLFVRRSLLEREPSTPLHRLQKTQSIIGKT